MPAGLNQKKSNFSGINNIHFFLYFFPAENALSISFPTEKYADWE